MKLKTLDDLIKEKIIAMKKEGLLLHPASEMPISPRVLKQEAIKWVKFYKRKLKEAQSSMLKGYYQGKFEATMEQNNITEEDLK